MFRYIGIRLSTENQIKLAWQRILIT